MTEFGRALFELNIILICANSSQAKGRVERANKTRQDRLIKEMRLAAFILLKTLMSGYLALLLILISVLQEHPTHYTMPIVHYENPQKSWMIFFLVNEAAFSLALLLSNTIKLFI